MKTPLYRFCGWILQAALGFYFSRIEKFHPERVPKTGPLLFTSNHPNSLTDAFVIGTSVPRKVSFVATVQLFSIRPLRWLLTQCGVIPINRMKDDPRAMRSVMDTFEACFRVLEKGEAVAIFPEGITHDDPQLKTVKTGAARMALELEHRHEGKLGLQVMPVGLTLSAKERYRSEVLVHFGEPLRVSGWITGYSENKRECIQKLTSEIETRIEALIVHLRHLERARVVQAVKKLYLDRLLVGNRVIIEPVPPRAEELILSQAIAAAVDFIYENRPETAAEFSEKLGRFERNLKRLHLSEDDLAHFPDRRQVLKHSLLFAILAVTLLPIAIYGWLHRALPVLVVKRITKRAAPLGHGGKTHISTTSIVAGAVCFSFFYCIYFALAYALFGFEASVWYALSLPIAGLIAYWYLGETRRFAACLRCAYVLLRAPSAARHLIGLRDDLIAQIESARWQVPATALSQASRAAI